MVHSIKTNLDSFGSNKSLNENYEYTKNGYSPLTTINIYHNDCVKDGTAPLFSMTKNCEDVDLLDVLKSMVNFFNGRIINADFGYGIFNDKFCIKNDLNEHYPPSKVFNPMKKVDYGNLKTIKSTDANNSSVWINSQNSINNLNLCEIVDTSFKHGLFKDIIIQNCGFYNCNFYKANFDNVVFENCKFYNCEFTGVLFSSLYVYNSKFDTSCSFLNSSWKDCVLDLYRGPNMNNGASTAFKVKTEPSKENLFPSIKENKSNCNFDSFKNISIEKSYIIVPEKDEHGAFNNKQIELIDWINR